MTNSDLFPDDPQNDPVRMVELIDHCHTLLNALMIHTTLDQFAMLQIQLDDIAKVHGWTLFERIQAVDRIRLQQREDKKP